MPSEITFLNKEEWAASGKKHYGWTRCPKCDGRIKGARRSQAIECPADGCDHVFPESQKSATTTTTATAPAKESNETTIMKSLKAKEWLTKNGKVKDEEQLKEKATEFFDDIKPPEKMTASEVLNALDDVGETGLRKMLKGKVANEEWHDFKQALGRTSSAVKFISDYHRMTAKK